MAGSQSRPQWILKHMSEPEIQSLTNLIGEVESLTEGELVLVIVKSSTPRMLFRYFIFVLLLCCLFIVELPESRFLGKSEFIWGLPVLAILAFYLSKFMAESAGILRRIYPAEELRLHVENRALLEFHLNGMKNTENRTGILIFVSFDERKVVVLGDQSISAKLPVETWQNICRGMVRRLKEGSMSLAFQEAIVQCGEILKTHFPAKTENPNELSNHFLVKD